MKQLHRLSTLAWEVAGSFPDLWRLARTERLSQRNDLDVSPVKARVPGSVQASLLEAGLLPDWNLGLNSRQCEWVENRDWIYETVLPDDWIVPGRAIRLRCKGLDYCGDIVLNNKEIGSFKNAFMPQEFDLTPHLKETGNILQIAFTPPPRWLGQFAWTCHITDWKPRFNYYWDWVSRLLQVGIWDDVELVVSDGREIKELRCASEIDAASHAGTLRIMGAAHGQPGDRLRFTLRDGETVLRSEDIAPEAFNAAPLVWNDLTVRPWWPNGLGEQPLYTLECQLLDTAGEALDSQTRPVGFKQVEWRACLDAPPEADPWICVVNGQSVFLQGVNWTPLLPNFADLTEADYRKRLETYRDLGMNLLRVWGGGFPEKDWLFDICDELGLMVWMEFPLSSSGMDSWPPDTEPAMSELCEIARAYITRLQHHASIVLWCGGNELSADEQGGHSKPGGVCPADTRHPLLKRLGEIAAQMDPARRYLATSPSGPTGCASEESFGKGLNWDVHGPWKGGDLKSWTEFFDRDDSLFRSETGAPGASSVDLIRRYQGDCAAFPASTANPLWCRHPWWIEQEQFVKELGREPRDLEEYVAWNQARQAQLLAIAVESCKRRFPRCGGILLWMGHDSFPCTANTSILDFEGNPKPAALAVGKIFRVGE